MDESLKVLAVKVKKLSRDNASRTLASELVLKDMPLIVKDKYARFMKKPFNSGKDAIDFYFVTLSQTNKLIGIGSTRPTPKVVKEVEVVKEVKIEPTKQTMTIGDMIKLNAS